MEFKRLTSSEDPLYGQAMELYAASFPLHEQRFPASQAAILADPAYRFELLFEGEQWAGLLLCWETPEFLYVEHFCTLPQLRGGGLGQKALELLHREGKPVILEIDPPADPVSCRRKAFYERCGYCANPFPHVHPAYRPAFSGHPLVVLSYLAPLTEALFQTFSHYLQTTVMGR